MKYQKLVRDNIPFILEQKNLHPQYHTASDDEYRLKLKEKLEEEVKEYLTDEAVEELADVLEVVRALAELHSVSFEDIERKRIHKAKERGEFAKRIILEETDG